LKSQGLERKATIVDAPDLPPEDCQFFITEAGVADSGKVEYALGGGEAAKTPKKKNTHELKPRFSISRIAWRTASIASWQERPGRYP
jgi:hypothetical protein